MWRLALSVVVAVVFGVAQVRQAASDRRERLTLEALRNFQSREFAELIFYVNGRDMPSTREEVRALSDKDQVAFIQLAQEMESLGILVAEEIVNIDLIDKTLGAFVVNSWEKYKPAFLDMRKVIPDPFLGEYFQWLAEDISQRMNERPRKPFHELTESERKTARKAA